MIAWCGKASQLTLHRLAGRLLFYLFSWLVLSLGWLIVVAACGATIYRWVFRFDAFLPSNWVGLFSFFLAGGVIPFDFAALAILLAFLWLAGSAVAIRRLPASRRWLAWWLSGVRYPDPLLMACRVQHLVGTAMPKVREGLRRLARWRRRLERRRDGGRNTARLRSEISVRADPPMLKAMPAAPLADAVASSGNAVEAADSADSAEHEETLPAPAADAAALGRALVLLDVWIEPPPQWLDEALREEIDAVSAKGWALLAEFGQAGRQLLDLMALRSILPTAPVKRSAVESLLAIRDAEAAGHAPENSDGGEADDVVEGDPPEPGSIGTEGLTLSAAWLCDLLGNHAMLEEIRRDNDAEGFDRRWGAVHRQTRDHLAEAMRTMSDQDWASLDRFPDRAGRVRVLTDRLREEFRRAAASASASAEEDAEARPPGPASPSPAMHLSAAEQAEALLTGNGFVTGILIDPAPRISAAAPDLVGRRKDLTVVLRLCSLDGADWRLDGGYLGAWRSSGRADLASPCRALWQRLALMRSVGKETGRLLGLVVVSGGGIEDEAALAAAVGRDRDRTGVELAWLDDIARSLPGLNQRLAEISGSLPPTG